MGESCAFPRTQILTRAHLVSWPKMLGADADVSCHHMPIKSRLSAVLNSIVHAVHLQRSENVAKVLCNKYPLLAFFMFGISENPHGGVLELWPGDSNHDA